MLYLALHIILWQKRKPCQHTVITATKIKGGLHSNLVVRSNFGKISAYWLNYKVSFNLRNHRSHLQGTNEPMLRNTM